MKILEKKYKDEQKKIYIPNINSESELEIAESFLLEMGYIFHSGMSPITFYKKNMILYGTDNGYGEHHYAEDVLINEGYEKISLMEILINKVY